MESLNKDAEPYIRSNEDWYVKSDAQNLNVIYGPLLYFKLN